MDEDKRRETRCLEELCTLIYDKFICLSLSSSTQVPGDGDAVSSYAIELLRIGCLYMKFADAIREGDGERVLRCWRYFLPIVSAHRRILGMASVVCVLVKICALVSS